MISFWGEIAVLLLENQNLRIFLLGNILPWEEYSLGGSGITVGLFWEAVWVVCDRQVIFHAGCLPWNHVLWTEEVI